MVENKPSIDPDTCLGCGHCAAACKTNSLVMKVDPQRIPDYKEPGPLKIAMVLILTATMYLIFRRFKAASKSENYKYGKAKPRQSDLIRLD
jgi:ferredoxin